MRRRLRAIVVGAGVAGLTAALALRRVGIEVEVYERSAGLHESGAGLALATNAMRALTLLGMAETVRRSGSAVDVVEIRTWRGTCLQRVDVGRLGRQMGGPTLCVSRPELLAVLAEAFAQEAIRFGKACTGYTTDEHGVVASFADGTYARGDVLVAADGLRSVVRCQLFGGDSLRDAGYIAWRGIAPVGLDVVPNGTALEAWGRGARAGVWRIDDGRVYWWATSNTTPSTQVDASDDWSLLRQRFRDWCRPIPDLIEATSPSAVLRTPVFDREPIRHWVDGRVALAGDAAHPMTPDLGQGACQAMEDAVTLAACLAHTGDPVAGLVLYESLRRPRATRVVLA